jgi:PAS domain S-box-containing protein
MMVAQGKRIERLVGFLIVAGLLFGGIMLLLISQNLNLLHQHRARSDEQAREIASAAEQLAQAAIRSRMRIDALLEREDSESLELGEGDAGLEAVVREGSQVNGAPDEEILMELKPLVARLSQCRAGIISWRRRFDPIRQDVRQQRTLGSVRKLLLQCREAVEILEGEWRLAEAVQYRAWRSASATEAPSIASSILNHLAGRRQTGLTPLQRPLADLGGIVDRIADETDLDNLVNLSENEVKPILENVHNFTVAMENSALTRGKFPLENFRALLSVLLGHGRSHEPGQPFLELGQGGLLNLRRSFLELHAEKQKLASEAAKLFAGIEGLNVRFLQASREKTILLDKDVTAELAASWRRVLMIAAVVGGLFFWPALRIRQAIRSQVRVLQEATSQAKAAHETTHGLMLEQTAAAERYAALSRENMLLLNSGSEGILGLDREGKVTFINPTALRLLGGEPDTWIGRSGHGSWHRSLDPSPTVDCAFCAAIRTGVEWRSDAECFWREDGRSFETDYAVTPTRDESGRMLGAVVFFRDISVRRRQEKERTQMELQLRQAQKLQAIGHLAAGIAHEINTPVQFMGDNTRFLGENFASLDRLLGRCGDLIQAAQSSRNTTELAEECRALWTAADVDYLRAEVPTALRQTLEGVDRIAKIVRAMKDFSHPGSDQKMPSDLNKLIESTLTVCRTEWKYVAELVTEFDPTLSAVPCLPGEFNQVILNLVVNAAHAITDGLGTNAGTKGKLTIITRRIGPWAEVRITDTGTGIPESARPHIFEQFFTTKEVGRGTGQGLAMAHSVITQKHGGTIAFETEVGKGTTFILRLPLVVPGAMGPKSARTLPTVPDGPRDSLPVLTETIT